ncbi:MAG: DUF2203 domain-containing protein [Candidatus Methylomirabilia bacterium]
MEKEGSKKYFTPGEVEALIPELTRIMARLMDTHGEVRQIRSVLHEEQRRIMVAGGGILNREVWSERRRRLEIVMREMKDGIAAIVKLGGVPKDLGMGLVDFPHLLGKQEVNLCWRFGETRVRFWHGLEEGYAGRKPLEEA